MTTFDKDYLKTTFDNASAHLASAVKVLADAPTSDKVDLNRVGLHLTGAMNVLHDAANHVDNAAQPGDPHDPLKTVPAASLPDPAKPVPHEDLDIMRTPAPILESAMRNSEPPAPRAPYVAPPAPPKDSSNSLIIIIVGVVLALAAGGAAYWHYLGR